MIIPISIDLKDTITDSNHNPLGMRTDRLTKEPIVSCGDADAPPQSTCQTSAVRCPPFFSTSFFFLTAIVGSKASYKICKILQTIGLTIL